MLALEIIGEGNTVFAQRFQLGAALGDNLVFVLRLILWLSREGTQLKKWWCLGQAGSQLGP